MTWSFFRWNGARFLGIAIWLVEVGGVICGQNLAGGLRVITQIAVARAMFSTHHLAEIFGSESLQQMGRAPRWEAV